MRILDESTDDLTVFCPALTVNGIAAFAVAMGFLALPFVGHVYLSGGIAAFQSRPLAFAVVLCMILVVGLFALIRMRDTEYHFLGSQHVLSVRDRRGERQVIPFSEIVEADDYAERSQDGPLRYGLRLKLRGHHILQMSRGESSGWGRCRQMSELATRINQFLGAHRSELRDASLRAAYEIAEAAFSVSPESKRTKTCPHCGKDLSVYAVKCRFCHASIE